MFDGAKPTCPGAPWRDLRFRGPVLEMFIGRTRPVVELTAVRA